MEKAVNRRMEAEGQMMLEMTWDPLVADHACELLGEQS
jgi:hypothetical protein